MRLRSRFQVSLRTKILGAFLGMTALAAALLSFALLGATRAMRERTVQQLEVLAAAEGFEIRTTMDRLLADVVSMSQVPALEQYVEARSVVAANEAEAARMTRMSEELLIFARAKKCYQPVLLRVTDENDREVVRLEDHGGGLSAVAVQSETTAADPVIRAAAALPLGRVYASPVARMGADDTPGAGGGTQIEYATPLISDSGRARGVLALRVRLDYLLTHIGQRPPDGIAFLATKEGRYLARDQAPKAPTGAGGRPADVRSEFGAEDAARLLGGRPGSLVSRAGTVAAFFPIPVGNLAEGRYWIFGMSAPSASFLAPVHSFFKTSAVLLLVALVGVAILAVFVTRHFTVPLRELHRSTEIIASGDLNYRIRLRTGDEMESLAEKFNTMTDRLAASRRELESWNQRLHHEVDERTHELRDAEARVRAEKQKLDDIVSSMGADLCLISRDLRILWANRVLTEKEGGAEQVIGRHCYEVLREKPKTCHDCHWGHVQKTGEPYHETLSRRTSSGHERYQQVIATPVKDDSGNVVELLRLSVDVTEAVLRERATRSHLAETEKLAALGRLAAGVVHDVANPLAAIKTTLQVMQENVNGDPRLGPYVTRAIAEIDRLSDFLKRFSAFAKPTPPSFECHDLTRLVREVLALFESTARARQITLCDRLDSRPMEAVVDPARIRQVVMNLLINAIDATDAAGAITVEAFSDVRSENGSASAHVCIAVADNGSGIADEHLSHIFEPFFTTKPNGTGLGLAITHQIAREHSGNVEVESVAGRGSRFVLRFPKERPRKLEETLLAEEMAHMPIVPVAGLA